MYDVIVVGAGISGLTAAKRLVEQGKTVLVLEAQNYIGGRIQTDRRHEIPIDLGGSWVYDQKTNPLVKDYGSGMKLMPFGDILSGSGRHVLYGSDGKALEGEQLEAVKSYVGIFLEYIASQADDLTLQTIFANFHLYEMGASMPDAMRLWMKNLLAFWTGAELEKTSVAVWKAMVEGEGGDAAYLLNGYGSIVDAIASGLDIQLNSRVDSVNYTDEGIRVSVGAKVHTAPSVIITLPIGILKNRSVAFIPKLPIEKMRAIERIGCGVFEKSVLQFDACFWDPSAESIQCIPSPDSPVQFYINLQKLYEKPILVAIYADDAVCQLNRFPGDHKQEVLLAPLRKIYGEKFSEPRSVSHTSWSTSPDFACSYSYLPTGASAADVIALAEPIEGGRICFAGEATSSDAAGTVHGAYQSGLDAAQVVLDFLRQPALGP